MVTELSPVKVSRKNSSVRYFDGKLSDSRKTVQVISFDTSLHTKLESSRIEKSCVSLVNCDVKAVSGARLEKPGKMEIMATNQTKVAVSPRKFEVSEVSEADVPKEVNISEVDGLERGQRVTIVVKVVNVATAVTVTSRDSKELRK